MSNLSTILRVTKNNGVTAFEDVFYDTFWIKVDGIIVYDSVYGVAMRKDKDNPAEPSLMRLSKKVSSQVGNTKKERGVRR